MKKHIELLRHRRSTRFITVFTCLTIIMLGADWAQAQSQWTTNGDNISNANTGNVGVGITTPVPPGSNVKVIDVRGSNGGGLTFGITGGAKTYLYRYVDQNTWFDYSGADLLFFSNSEKIRFTNAGRVGIGTTTPANHLHIGNSAGAATFLVAGSGSSVVNMQDTSAPVDSKLYQWRSEGGVFRMALVNDSWNTFIQQNLLVATSEGKIGIGTASPTAKLHVEGDLKVTGNIAAKYQDVAEWVPSTQELSAGTVVVLDTEKSNHVIASSVAYDTRVAGVVSAQPGVILGEGGQGKFMVATTGRLRVKVDATRTPIKVGDLLVTGDGEGVAMKSMPIDLSGTPIHRPGTIIGKALEPLAHGTGEILVLLSLQ